MDNTAKSSTKRLLALLTASVCLILFSGCYTQLMQYQGETMMGREGGACDEGCPDEVAANSARREICVWERDIFGYPEMRCYNTLYHSSWMYFHSTPWWYRNSFGWHDTRGCPPNYYYDRFTGICRRYGHTYPPANSGIGGGGRPPISREPAPQRRNPRGTPSATPPASSGAASVPSAPNPGSSGLPPLFNDAALKTLSPVGAPVQPSTPASTPPGQPMAKPQEEQPGKSTQEVQVPKQQNNEHKEAPQRRNMRGGR